MIGVIPSLTGNLELGPYHDMYANARPPMGLGGDNYYCFIFASLYLSQQFTKNFLSFRLLIFILIDLKSNKKTLKNILLTYIHL